MSFLGIQRYYPRLRFLALPLPPPQTVDVVFLPLLSHEDIPRRGHQRQRQRQRQAALQRHGEGAQGEHEATERQAPATDVHHARNDKFRAWAWLAVVDQELACAANIAPTIDLVSSVHAVMEAEAFRAAWQYVVAGRPTELG